jgi:hypothetical protein
VVSLISSSLAWGIWNWHLNGTAHCWSIKHLQYIKMLQKVYSSHVEVFEWILLHKNITTSQLKKGHSWYSWGSNSLLEDLITKDY